jgi:predicted Holliday junction resolvase-like endonuclease
MSCVLLCISLFVLFLVVIVLHVLLCSAMSERHAIQWPQERTNNDIHNTIQKDMQYNDHKKEQTMIYITLHRRTCNTMTTRKRSAMYIIVCSFLWSLYCMSFCVVLCISLFVLFLVVIVLHVQGHAIQWPQEREQTMIYITLHRRTCNTMTTRKRTNNNIHSTTQKDMQYNDHKKENKQWYTIVLHVLLCSVMYINVCSLSCGHCIACPSV